MKFKILSALVVLGVFSGYQMVQAEYDNVAGVIHDIEMDGLSMKSTDKDIEAFISAHPLLQCNRVDVPESQSMNKKRPPKPRWQSWTCFYTHKTLSQILNIHMSGGTIVHLDYQTGYEDPKDFEKTVSHFRSLYQRFKNTGIPEDQSDPKNKMTYVDQDVVGGSSPSFMQNLHLVTEVKCEDLPVPFDVSLNANNIPSQDVYRAGISINRKNYQYTQSCKYF